VRLRIIAVGTRMPTWVTEAYNDYSKRLPPPVRPELVELSPGHRGSVERAIADEGKRLLASVGVGDFVVMLDERGKALTSLQWSAWLGERRLDGSDVAFLIGGPDGFDPAVRARANATWSLSSLTFPHAVVRVLLIEQLYRAHALLTNHPYHRE
jgi:23S rRNA (pseudouridine1915-N3)-methyltransferase